MSVDALTMAYQNHYDAGLFLLGDRDFIPLIDAVKNAGKKTYLFCYVDKVSKELIQMFDFRYGFNRNVMEEWHITRKCGR